MKINKLFQILCCCMFLVQLPVQAIGHKSVVAPKISCSTTLSASDVPGLMDSEQVPFSSIGIVNWDKFPYRPEVSFRIAHTGNYILVHYRVKEKSVLAATPKDNGLVCTDSCVEFFLSPNSDSFYYNFESNCVGTLLIASGTSQQKRQKADQKTLSSVQRWSSLGRKPFQERVGTCQWEVALVIPANVLSVRSIQSLDGLRMKGNFYKCGDKMMTPHYLSWSPIDLPNPCFHCPQFFGDIIFE